MSKAKRSQQQSEPLLPPKWLVDPLYMVVLRSASGQVHLVDRNSALVSQRCRRFLESVESKVLQTGEPGDSVPHGAAAASPPTALFYGIQNKGKVGVTAAADGPVTTPAAAEERAFFTSVPLTTLYEAYQQRLAAAADQQHNQQRAEAPRNNSANGNRRTGGTTASIAPAAASVSPPPVSWPPAFGALDSTVRSDDDGVTLYPVIDLPDVPDGLLEVALGFMYLKYHNDTDHGEKRQSLGVTASFEDSYNPEQLLAASVILEI